MFYKLYRERTSVPADKSIGFKLAAKFQKIYDQNGVKFIGEWINADDLYEHFFMTAYRDESHFKDFIEKTKSNKKYQEMSEELKKERVSIVGITLNASPDFRLVSDQKRKKDQPDLFKLYMQKTRTPSATKYPNV